MGFWAGFAIGGILGGIFGIVIFSLIFGTRKEGMAEAGGDHQRRQNDAIIADQERADEIATRADAAARASGGEPAAVRLRKAGRLRETGQ